MDIYAKYPLPHANSIRVLLLLPAPSCRSEIRCELQVIRLSDAATGSDESAYMTLSYSWGSQANPHSIIVDGQKLKIGRNLYSALQSLRRRDRPLKIWADAICINQQDTNERNHQVQQMRAIYATSSETIIFLGLEDGSAAGRNAWNFIEYRSQWALNETKDPDRAVPKRRQKQVKFKSAYNDVLNTVLSREWFSRIWIIQEVVVSKSLAIQCGDRRVSWEDFTRTLFLYFQEGRFNDDRTVRFRSRAIDSLMDLSPKSTIAELRPGWETVRGKNPNWKHIIQPVKEMCQTRFLYQSTQRASKGTMPDWMLNEPLAHFIENDTDFRFGSLTLSQLLARGRRFKSTDPRDKVIALLGICTGINRLDTESLIDYEKPALQIFSDATRLLIEMEGTLDLLSQAGQQTIEEDVNLPSWAGRWDSAFFPPISVLSRLGTEEDELIKKRRAVVEEHHTWSLDGKTLYCTGGKMGTLVAIDDLHIGPTTWKPENPDVSAELMREAELAQMFSQCARSLLEKTPWSTFPDIVGVNMGSIVTETVYTRQNRGGWKVEFTLLSAQGSSINGDAFSEIKKQYIIHGGPGFINDVTALQQGRRLGLIRCQSGHAEEKEGTASYDFAVVPECARVGDIVGSFTGCRTVFLLYPDHTSIMVDDAKDVKREEERVRQILPKSHNQDPEMMHCRLRGECRVNAFEDHWGLDDRMPVMAYIGYIPVEWRDRIFAIH